MEGTFIQILSHSDQFQAPLTIRRGESVPGIQRPRRLLPPDAGEAEPGLRRRRWHLQEAAEGVPGGRGKAEAGTGMRSKVRTMPRSTVHEFF